MHKKIEKDVERLEAMLPEDEAKAKAADKPPKKGK